MKSQAVLDLIFETIWEEWPNKDKEHAAKKAFNVFAKSGEDVDLLQRACRIYVLDSSGDEFHYQLNNFILQDHWKDVIESGTSLEKLEKERIECIDLIETWNKSCLSHWIKSEDIEDKIPSARKALQNKYFKKNWRKALDKATKIFKYKFRDGDPRQRIILSFRWFSRCMPEKHTVLKIMEGEYGVAHKDPKKKEIKFKEITNEERKRLIADFKDVFSDFSKPNPTKKKASTESKPNEKLVEKLLSNVTNQEDTEASKGISEADGSNPDDDEFALT